MIEPNDPIEIDDEVAEDRARSRRSVSFILAVVGAAVAVMIALAAWVVLVPYDVEVAAGEEHPVRCDDLAEDAPSALATECDRLEDEARDERRTTALVIGVGAFVVATAVSTWPSHRLTGDRLGPLR